MGNGHITHLTCVACGRRYPPAEARYTCPRCGIRGILDVAYDYEAVAGSGAFSREALTGSRECSQWRYLPLLPVVDPVGLPPLQVGWTPMHQADRLGQALGLADLWIKDEGRNPTGSFKDRASALGVARALAEGAGTVACASTGNAASSLAGFCAATGLPAVIFVPAGAPAAKVTQLMVFGATVLEVEGSYDQAYYVCNDAAERFGWYNRNCAVNPYLIEGKKTAGFEICEQMNFEPPDWVVVSVGDGCTIAGIWKAFTEFLRLGLIDRLPRVLGVQAEGADPLVRASEALMEPGAGPAGTPQAADPSQAAEPPGPGQTGQPGQIGQSGQTVDPRAPALSGPARTVADSIAVAQPRNAVKALRAARDSGGRLLRVSDEAIIEAISMLGRTSGVFAEPAGAAGLAGIREALARGLIRSHERVVLVVTGNGLKDVTSAQRLEGAVIPVRPDLDSVVESMERLGWGRGQRR